jgi:hypothetical protein
MIKIVALILLVGVHIGAFAQEAIPGEPELSRWLTNQPMKKSYRWGLESAVVVGDRLSCIASKQTYLDPVPNPFHGSTHFSSEATEYAFVTYSLARGKGGAREVIVPLGKYQQLTYDFRLLPGSTNVLVRKSSVRDVTKPITLQCWSLSPPSTNIVLSREVALPLARSRVTRSRFLGSGYDAALFLSANGVLCLNLPGMTTNFEFAGQRILDDYFSSLGTNVQVLSAQVAGNLDYLICYGEHLNPVRREAAVVDLRTGKGVERQSELGGEPNVVNGELLFLKWHYEKISGNRFKQWYQIVSRTGAVRASLEIDLARVLAWSDDSPTVVFEINNRNEGRRKTGLLVWDFQSGERWPITVELPERLSK